MGVDNVNRGCYNWGEIGLKYFKKGGGRLVKSSTPGQRGGLATWLEGMCQKEGLSLRLAAKKTGLSHATIADLIKGVNPAPESIKKLAVAFAESGDHHKQALEDKLLVLAGYRSERPEEREIAEPMARLMDKLSDLNEPQLKVMERFAEFLAELGLGKEVKR